MKSINLHRQNITLYPDNKRVLLRPFHIMTGQRASEICSYIMELSDLQVETLVRQLWVDFEGRHKNIRRFFRSRFEEARPYLLSDQAVSDERALLIGSYFSHEYSHEAAALFNPSIVPHLDQSRLELGSRRFILSLRSTGEGHVSSISFRTGVVDSNGSVEIEPPSRYSLGPARVVNAPIEKSLFERKLRELNLTGAFSREVLKLHGDSFTLEELGTSIVAATKKLQVHDVEIEKLTRQTLALARSSFELQFDADTSVSERVIFPVTPAQSRGMEDARFVLFHDDDGRKTYFATYTAYDGTNIQSELLETADFLHFKFTELHGPAVRNKGMALFPRKIDGRYAMLGRQDFANLYLMFSDNLHLWQKKKLVLRPKYPWEFVQMGNCGSPIETEAGWLVLSHGVGPMRKYCIGAFLLDLDAPTKVIGRLREPLIVPNDQEREGYVPNVVYSCGSLVHSGRLIIPYGTSDSATAFATVDLDELLSAMDESGS